MEISNLPAINACINGVATVLLLGGFIAIKKKNESLHRAFMVAALIASTLFLACYLYYHANISGGHVKYPLQDWTRYVYFAILIPHIILAAGMCPFIIAMVIYAIKDRRETHKKIARWIWPIWMYVSVTGVVIYLMLYQYAGATAQ